MKETKTSAGGSLLWDHVPGAPTLLFLHGQLGRREDLLALSAPLLDRRSVALLDLPWHGTASAPRGGSAEEVLGGAVRSALDELPGPVVLVGHSLGALAAALVLDDPRVSRAVLIGFPGDFSDEGRARQSGTADLIEQAGFPDALGDVGVKLWYSAAYQARTPDLLEVVLRRLRRNDAPAAAACARALAAFGPVNDRVKHARCQVHLVGGVDDASTPLGNVEHLVPPARVLRVSGGHFPHEESGESAAAIRALL